MPRRFMQALIRDVAYSGIPSRAKRITQRASSLRCVRASAASTTSAGTIPPMATITRVPHSSLHVSKPTWWLESRFHFCFADYWDPRRERFGVLRVLNDDLVQPRAGFGTHPHRDAEIFSYVVDGQLSHSDSLGNRESLPRGCLQYMSAGSGVSHSEMNEGAHVCRFLQVWISPDRRGHKPQYGSRRFEPAQRHNRLLQLLGGTGPTPAWPGLMQEQQQRQGAAGAAAAAAAAGEELVRLHQDANVVVSESDPGVTFDLSLAAGRQAYITCIEGSLQVNEVPLDTRDGCRVVGRAEGTCPLQLTAGPQGAHFLAIEMALEK
ncbi:hypothetical protein Agub_g5519 [Astrephomene gubernaculifera]|uniref:Pirin n=1 Tax=Astrephomene gubernaculifera TaxID=47775 RepID=A0AAD3DPM5_9CHLO|nr:hypothetical protein Agub_g5519 [Astrephomene gubernaculifera]